MSCWCIAQRRWNADNFLSKKWCRFTISSVYWTFYPLCCHPANVRGHFWWFFEKTHPMLIIMSPSWFRDFVRRPLELTDLKINYNFRLLMRIFIYYNFMYISIIASSATKIEATMRSWHVVVFNSLRRKNGCGVCVDRSTFSKSKSTRNRVRQTIGGFYMIRSLTWVLCIRYYYLYVILKTKKC